MNGKGNGGVATGDRIKIQEKALSDLADALRRHDTECAGDLREIQDELKALKLFLARNNPEFKKQFPEIRRKVK